MKLTPKLLGMLNRVFEKDPEPFLALRVRYTGGLTWSVEEGVLSLTVVGGVGSSVSYDLASYTLQTLAAAIAARPGFEVAYMSGERRALSALVLLDGAGDQAESNGDHLLGYTSILWAIVEAWARVLQVLRLDMEEVPKQLVTNTARDSWLDELGSYYGVVRLPGEVDALYGQRIIAETVRPVSNNVAIERAIEDYTGQACKVVDVTIYVGTFPLYDGTIDYDGTYDFDNVGEVRYGLFDIQVAYDLLAGGDIVEFTDTVSAIVGRLRAAGTQLRALALIAAAPIVDAFPFAPVDSMLEITILDTGADTATAPTEALGVFDVRMASVTDALPAPAETVSGTVYAKLTDELGAPVVDENGDPLLVPVGALFD